MEKKTSKQAAEQVVNNRSLTHFLICCPVEIVGEALESGSGIPEKETYPNKNRERLTLCVKKRGRKNNNKKVCRFKQRTGKNQSLNLLFGNDFL